MGNVAVVLGADTPFGQSVCRNMLDKGWAVFGGIAPGASAVEAESLIAAYPAHYRAIPMDPGSVQSLESAAALVANSADRIDLLVSNANQPQADSWDEGLDFESILQSCDRNALTPLRFVEAFLPWTHSGIRRLCFVSSIWGSVERATHKDRFGYSMSLSALHMSIKIMSNHLIKEGYTFRVFLSSGEPDLSLEERGRTAEAACRLFLDNDENLSRLLVTDYHGKKTTI